MNLKLRIDDDDDSDDDIDDDIDEAAAAAAAAAAAVLLLGGLEIWGVHMGSKVPFVLVVGAVLARQRFFKHFERDGNVMNCKPATEYLREVSLPCQVLKVLQSSAPGKLHLTAGMEGPELKLKVPV
ncbi:hypothetical protein BO86DRAFT_439162 [Aspergillus japonicus CBS 114.51]|uniref:Uncharacterized protein n=1 Tax=Aspergillus japonicus CBS 114.51 TaxID=1448312 RepID=A0A8T8WR62_ASPJA|nr:hypothetical protein BO86DRAFT_439162 [Aspergillus japonicus CBS 114.51]RAH78163.1 hypothetical protein BO86DRAFT_439162 [Aspergillus japonicus CBS 114.51]